MIERMKKILDLYSGLGGASEAFLLSKRWDVMRIENNELLNQVPNTQMADVKELLNHLQNSQLPLDHRVDVVWSSPPCLEFSQAYSHPARLLREPVKILLPICLILKPHWKLLRS